MKEKYALANLLPGILNIAHQAGAAILDIAARDTELAVCSKADNSPVTEADLVAHQLISTGLSNLTPSFPQLSEESEVTEFAIRSQWEQYWLIDPLDGTKEFIAGTDEYTINIALIQYGKPILGLVHIPATNRSYAAMKNNGSYSCQDKGEFEPLEARVWLSEAPSLTISRRHHSQNPALLELINEIGDVSKILAGSSLKFCLLAEGRADLYPRFGPTYEWDTAAGQIILEEAGGAILDLNGHPLRYNTKDSLINPFFLAVADAKQDWNPVLDKIRAQV